MGRMSGRRALGALLVVGLLGTATYALTAANTVPGARAGDGSGAISGYTVSNVQYAVNSTNPQNIDSVSFTLDTAPGAGSITKVQLAPAGSWYSCTASGADMTCPTTAPTQATVAAASDLRVVSVQ